MSNHFPFLHQLTPLSPSLLKVPLNYNLASEYFPDLGFFVSVDGAMRLDRQLPSAALLTFAPPGSFYLDNPVGAAWGGLVLLGSLYPHFFTHFPCTGSSSAFSTLHLPHTFLIDR